MVAKGWARACAAVAATVVATACGTGGEPARSPTAAARDLDVAVTVGEPFAADPGDGCPAAIDGFPGMREGARVTLRDGAGTVLAVGSLDAGEAVAATTPDGEAVDGRAFCRFGATLDDVAAAEFYEVTVAERDAHVLAASEVADDRAVHVTVGPAHVDPARLAAEAETAAEAERAERAEREAAERAEEDAARERDRQAAAEQVAADRAMVADHFRVLSDKPADGVDAYVSFAHERNYYRRALGYSEEQCVAAWYGNRPYHLDAEYIPRPGTIERSAGWVDPQTGAPPDGRTYVLTVDIYEEADGYVLQDRPSDVHVTIIDGVTYHFFGCRVDV